MPALVCRRCGARYELTEVPAWACPSCGGLLYVRKEVSWEPKGTGLARYSSLLPLPLSVSLGEGQTPCVKRKFRGVSVSLKLEYLNPTGSFKDRGAALSVSHAIQLGFRSVVEDSSGNTGLSVAAYASAAGLNPLVVVPADAPRGKKLLIELFGGRLVEVGSRREAAERAASMARKGDTYYVAHASNPVFVEGVKTIAYELYEERCLGEYLVLPVASGTLLLGAYWGLQELKDLGLIDSLPKLVAVQGVEVCPLYRAMGLEGVMRGSSKLLDALRVEAPPRLEDMKEAVVRTNGLVVVVEDGEVREALRDLYRAGFAVEPSSAAPLAALTRLLEDGVLDAGDSVTIPLTGTGFKMLEPIAKILSASETRYTPFKHARGT